MLLYFFLEDCLTSQHKFGTLCAPSNLPFAIFCPLWAVRCFMTIMLQIQFHRSGLWIFMRERRDDILAYFMHTFNWFRLREIYLVRYHMGKKFPFLLLYVWHLRALFSWKYFQYNTVCTISMLRSAVWYLSFLPFILILYFHSI